MNYLLLFRQNLSASAYMLQRENNIVPSSRLIEKIVVKFIFSELGVFLGRKLRKHQTNTKSTPTRKHKKQLYVFYRRIFKFVHAYTNSTKFFNYNSKFKAHFFSSDFNKLKANQIDVPFNWRTSGLKNKKLVSKLSISNLRRFLTSRKQLIKYSKDKVLPSWKLSKFRLILLLFLSQAAFLKFPASKSVISKNNFNISFIKSCFAAVTVSSKILLMDVLNHFNTLN